MSESTTMRYGIGVRRIQRWIQLVCVAALCCLFFSADGFAAPCGTVTSVQNSAILANNTADGGHVLKHITGAVNPPTSQRNATMFADTGQYSNVWNGYTQYGVQVDCADGSANGAKVSQQIAVSDLNLSTDDDTLQACQCGTNVVNNTCRKGYFNFSSTITFVFKVVNSKWILLTAYPLYGVPTTDVCVGQAPGASKKL